MKGSGELDWRQLQTIVLTVSIVVTMVTPRAAGCRVPPLAAAGHGATCLGALAGRIFNEW